MFDTLGNMGRCWIGLREAKLLKRFCLFQPGSSN